MDTESIEMLKNFITPHIALTFFKFRARAIALLKENGVEITIDQFIILKVLAQFPDSPQQELSKLLYKDKSNFSRLVDNLDKKGFLKRRSDINGKRTVKKLMITDEGKSVVEKVTPLASSLQTIGTRGISQEELDTLKIVLGKIRKNLGEDF